MTPQSELEKAYSLLDAKGIGGQNGVSTNLVKGFGPVPSDIMFIGEAPGEVEDQTGIPFMGSAGKAFNQLLGLIPVKREETFITNVFKYRPPNNRTPTAFEIAQCVDCLSAEIKAVNPKLVVAMGKPAMSVFYPGYDLVDVRSQFRKQPSGRYVFVTYHPALLLYDNNGSGKKKIRGDFQKIAEFVSAM